MRFPGRPHVLLRRFVVLAIFVAIGILLATSFHLVSGRAALHGQFELVYGVPWPTNDQQRTEIQPAVSAVIQLLALDSENISTLQVLTDEPAPKLIREAFDSRLNTAIRLMLAAGYEPQTIHDFPIDTPTSPVSNDFGVLAASIRAAQQEIEKITGYLPTLIKKE
jgi:hypothetical protein